MSAQKGPGLWWQFLEFVGMTWPGHKKPPPDPNLGAPPCSACGNLMRRPADGADWRCPHHPAATPTDADGS